MQTFEGSRSLMNRRYVGIAFLAAVTLSIVVPRMYYADLIEAEIGFGLVDYIASIVNEQVLSQGVAAGLESYGVTISMRLARILSTDLGIDPLLLQRVLYLLEPVSLLAAGAVLVKTTVPEKASAFRVLFLIVLTASTLRNSSFGTWPSPFYAGSFYVFAEAAGCVAVCALVQRRPVLAGLLFALSLAFHLSIGIGFVAFGAGVALYQLFTGAFPLRQVAPAAAAFLIPIGLWLWATLDRSAVSGGNIPDELWRRLVFAASYHTFPIQSGIFGLRHQTYFTGFVSFVLLLSVYLSRYWRTLLWPRELVAGSIAVSFVVAGGLIISVADASPFLIKLHLHRLNSLILLFGSPIIVYGLWNDIMKGNLILSIIAALAVATAFYLGHGIAAFPAFVIAAVHVRQLASANRRPEALFAGFAVCAFMAVFAIYAYLGFLRGPREPMYTGWTASVPALVGLGLCAIAVYVLKRFPGKRGSGSMVLIGVIAVMAINLQLASWPLSGSSLSRAKDFYQVQIWAKAESETDDLFLVDPSHSYGWRGYSERPTLGSVREWLYTNIVYSSDADELERGLELAGDFGIDMDQYLSGDEPLNGYYYALVHIRENYCQSKDDWLQKIAKKYNVKYFVFDKTYCTGKPSLEIKYENDSFYVGEI